MSPFRDKLSILAFVPTHIITQIAALLGGYCWHVVFIRGVIGIGKMLRDEDGYES